MAHWQQSIIDEFIQECSNEGIEVDVRYGGTSFRPVMIVTSDESVSEKVRSKLRKYDDRVINEKLEIKHYE